MHISFHLPMQQLLHVKCSSSNFVRLKLVFCELNVLISPFLLTIFFLWTKRLHQFLVLVCQQDHILIYILPFFCLFLLFCCEVNNNNIIIIPWTNSNYTNFLIEDIVNWSSVPATDMSDDAWVDSHSNDAMVSESILRTRSLKAH